MNTQRGFLLLLVSVLVIVAGLMLKPFVGYLFGAILLAFILKPLQDRLSPYLGGSISAFSLIILAFLVTTVPFILIISAVAGDAADVINDVTQTQVFDLDEVERVIQDYTGRSIDLEAEAQDVINRFVSITVGGFSEAINLLSSIAIGISVMLFMLFYMLRDGDEMVSYLRETIPLPDKILENLGKKTYRTTWAVIKGHIFVALAQGLIAGIGLWLTGVPNFAFWTFVMILLAFIPIVGAFMVWGPAAFYLLTIGQPLAGVLLFLYGVIVVGFTDNFVRPLMVDRSAELHPAVILIGVIGGVYVFGATGLFIGPIIFGVLKAVLEVFRKNYEEL